MRSSDPTHSATAIRSNLRKLPVAAAARITPAASNRDRLGYAEVPSGHGDPDELGDQGQRVQDEQVGDLERAPELPEPLDDEPGVPDPVTAPSRSTISWFT
jgi:hypothetical protein